ncbi:MAG: FISUMP domain-containing protein [Bacteroidota bacterium]
MVAALLLFCPSCKKAPEAPKGSSKIISGTTTVEEIKAKSVKASSSCNPGFQEIPDHGFCWGTNPEPDIGGFYQSLGPISEGGSFSSEITGLNLMTRYYIRSYAKDGNMVIYGAQSEFTTLDITFPSVTTASVTNITATNATCGGNVTSDGNGTVSARGVCWNTTGDPTLTNSIGHTTDGTGTGTFTSNLTGLNNGTTYFVTAYATNEKGTFNSIDIKQFIAQNPPCGQMTVSYGGQTYNTVKIGTQCWFKENLNIGTRINGSQNQTNNSTIEKYCYNDQESNCDTYGGLYQWDEMMQYVTTQGAKGICPDGWHIPTDAEWTTLTTYLGGESVAGGKMKEAGYAHWASPNTGANNSSGFTALPGGTRYSSGSFYNLTLSAYFWSSSQTDATYAWGRHLSYSNEYLGRYYYNKTYGFSCRCLQD